MKFLSNCFKGLMQRVGPSAEQARALHQKTDQPVRSVSSASAAIPARELHRGPECTLVIGTQRHG